MARSHQCKARADIYQYGKRTKTTKNKQGYSLDRSKPEDKSDMVIVKKGETYYWWQFKGGPKIISTTPPKPSQLTRSEFYSTLYDIEEQWNIAFSNAENADELNSAKDETIAALEELRDAQEEKKSNMPYSLQEGPTGELLQERYDAIDAIISEMDALSFDEEDEENEDWLEDARSECEQIDFMA